MERNIRKVQVLWITIVRVALQTVFKLPSLKLPYHLKMDGWSTIVSFWDGLFFGVFGSVIPRNYLHANLTVNKFIEFTAGCGLVFFTEFLLGVLANLALTSSVLVAVRNLSSTYSLTRALQSLLLGTQFWGLCFWVFFCWCQKLFKKPEVPRPSRNPMCYRW